MDRYYYLVSQLPFLSLDKRPTLSSRDFLEEARKWLSSKDFNCLVEASLDVFNENASMPLSLVSYKAFERSLRQSLAYLRKVDVIQPDFQQVEKIKNILEAANPLEKEKKLIFMRWEYIEELELGHFFDIDFLILYYIKLQLLERLFSFDKEKGQKIFDTLCEVA